MNEQPEKFDLRSDDITEDKQAELLRLFPEIRTEGGKIDFKRLKQALGESVDVGKERYGMVWPGKADCFKTIQQPSLGTLRPCPEESVSFDRTENLIIEGDNLEVLKLLQKSYLGKVKMIYIDPPYNTGNDFIYPDNYTESLQTYLEYTGQMGAEGKKFSTNAETDGRFHSKWLNMMYPRLYLARNLLREDGIIFVSIDDAEVDNLRKLCGEVFGEDNFLAVFVRRRRMATGMRDTPVSPDHEYVMCFAKNLQRAELFGFARRESDFPFTDKIGRYRSTDLTVGMTREMRPNQFYAIRNPDTQKEYWPPEERVWRFEPSTILNHIEDKNIIWPDDNPSGKMSRPRFKTRFDGGQPNAKTNPISTWINLKKEVPESEDDELTSLTAGLNQEATKELRELLGEQILDYPKPVSLIKGLCAIGSRGTDIVLDFFAGSGTTGHAVLELNKQDGFNRNFILVQLPEPTGREDYPTIADITKERVRRVIKKFNDEDSSELDLPGGERQDLGIRVFKLDVSNFQVWNANVPQGDMGKLQEQLEMHVDHVRDNRTDDDLLYELLLKSGYPLTTAVEKVDAAGKTFYSVADGLLLVCLDTELTHDLIKAMADRKPERVVCLDEGFAGNDQLKTNAVQTLKAKGVTSFKTV